MLLTFLPLTIYFPIVPTNCQHVKSMFTACTSCLDINFIGHNIFTLSKFFTHECTHFRQLIMLILHNILILLILSSVAFTLDMLAL